MKAMGPVIHRPERVTDPETLLQERAMVRESHSEEKVTDQVTQFPGISIQQEIRQKGKVTDLGSHQERVMVLVSH